MCVSGFIIDWQLKKAGSIFDMLYFLLCERVYIVTPF